MGRRIQSAAAFGTLLKSLVAAFAVWTLSYQIVLATRLPAYLAIVMCLAALAVIAVALTAKRKRGAARPEAEDGEPVLVVIALLLISALCAYFALIVNRIDWDDIDFYHRPLIQSRHLGEPFIIGDTVHDYPGLPGPTGMHLAASYEMFVSFAARIIGLDGLNLYQNGMCALAAFALPIVYFVLFRRLRLAPLAAVSATAGAILFLWTDGNLHASLGNLSFVRFWQGKWILLTLLFPLCVTFLLEYWERPSRRAWFFLFACEICGVGFSGTGIVIMPVLVFVVSAALATSDCVRKREFAGPAAKAVGANLASVYCALLAAGFQIGLIPVLRDMNGSPAALGHSLTWSWWQNLGLSIGTGWSPWWYAGLLVLGPLLAPSGSARWLTLAWSLVAAAVCFNGIAGPIWLKVLLAVFYRLVFVLPIAICAGLAAGGAVMLAGSSPRKMDTWLKAACVLALALLFHAHFQQATFSRSNRAFRKAPLEYRFQKKVLQFSRAVAPMLDNRKLLGPDEVVSVLPLLNLSTRLETQRWWVTLAYFHDIGRNDEGMRRMQAQAMVLKGRVSEPMFDVRLVDVLYGRPKTSPEEALRVSLQNGLDAIITQDAMLPGVQAVLGASGQTWQAAFAGNGYTLLLKR